MNIDHEAAKEWCVERSKTQGHPILDNLAACYLDLTEKLEAERKARAEAELLLLESNPMTRTWKQRAEKAESSLAELRRLAESLLQSSSFTTSARAEKSLRAFIERTKK